MITINFRDTNIQKYSSENKNGNICEFYNHITNIPFSTVLIKNIEYNFLCLIDNYKIELEIDSTDFLDYTPIIINNFYYILFEEIYFNEKWCIQCNKNSQIKFYYHFIGYDWKPYNFHSEIPLWNEYIINKDEYKEKKLEMLYYSESV